MIVILYNIPIYIYTTVYIRHIIRLVYVYTRGWYVDIFRSDKSGISHIGKAGRGLSVSCAASNLCRLLFDPKTREMGRGNFMPQPT